MTHKMTHTDKLQLAFLIKEAAQQESSNHGLFEGVDLENGLGTLGAGAGALTGFISGSEAGPHITRMADDILPKAENGPIGAATHFLESNKSIVPSSAEGWIPDAIRRTGMTKAHGSKMMGVLALLAPLLLAGGGGIVGNLAGKDIGRALDGKQ